MASSRERKLRIAASVLFATGFWDALAGRFVWEPNVPHSESDLPAPDGEMWRDLAGAVHIHSTYSDGAGDVPTVMQAACQANADWVLLADHNTQKPLRDGWEARYDDKPLLLVGTEISVENGAFLLALDMPPAWEPTRDKTPQATIDEVNEHGGLPLVSLPFDVKHPWVDWDVTGCAGLEVLNFSTIARRHINLLSLVWLLLLGRFRGTLAVIRALLTRPDAALARWDRLTENGTPSVGIGALDAHAQMKIGVNKYPIPSYADTMRAAMTHVLLPPDAEQTGEGARRSIYDALRAGRCYFSYDCLGNPSPVSWTGTNDQQTVVMGESLGRGANEAVQLRAHCPPKTLVRVYHRGRVVAAGANGQVELAATEPGAYRVEGYRYRAKCGPFFFGARPWLFTNPIYVRER